MGVCSFRNSLYSVRTALSIASFSLIVSLCYTKVNPSFLFSPGGNMTLVPVRPGTARKHAFVDADKYRFWPYGDGPSIDLPPLPFRFLQSLTLQPFDTVIPYERIAAFMWPDTVKTPYDGSYNRNIQDYLSGIKAVMMR